MKKLTYLFVVIVFAFGMNACAQEKNNDDLAMADNNTIVKTDAYNDDSNQLQKLKNMLIKELKKTDWGYEDSDYNKIKIVPNSLKHYEKSQTLIFYWTYRSKSTQYKGYDYYSKNRFKKDYELNKVWPASQVDTDYIKR